MKYGKVAVTFEGIQSQGSRLVEAQAENQTTFAHLQDCGMVFMQSYAGGVDAGEASHAQFLALCAAGICPDETLATRASEYLAGGRYINALRGTDEWAKIKQHLTVEGAIRAGQAASAKVKKDLGIKPQANVNNVPKAVTAIKTQAAKTAKALTKAIEATPEGEAVNPADIERAAVAASKGNTKRGKQRSDNAKDARSAKNDRDQRAAQTETERAVRLAIELAHSLNAGGVLTDAQEETLGNAISAMASRREGLDGASSAA